ncbi:MAG TPA: aminotransferase class V, partial [Synergistaceae bacterium]|nr:aminotransferase class V [Synergistaceae bacterium]
MYMNNAATTWPKPECVGRAMADFLAGGGANLARGTASGRDLKTLDLVFTCRERLAALLGGWGADPRLVTFTSGVTESLNVVLKGFLAPGRTVVTTSMEHNAVIRPLRRLESEGVRVEILPCDGEGFLPPAALERALRDLSPDLVILSHCSNVCGTIQDLPALAALCRTAKVPIVVDCAQTAGLLPLNAEELGLAALCFTGHKGLMGPQGIGGILWNPKFARAVRPLVEGGTGSFSHLERQPDAMPDKFESGTPNLPGIAGLSAALEWIDATGLDEIRAREEALGALMLEGLLAIEGLSLSGRRTMAGRLPVFAVNVEGVDNGDLAGF